MEKFRKGSKMQIPIQIKTYDSFLKRFKGLMFRVKPLEQEGIRIIPCNSIHMFFMFFAIDVVFLDKNDYVVKTVSNIKPWRIIWPVKQAYATLELPKGTIEKYEIQLQDQIVL